MLVAWNMSDKIYTTGNMIFICILVLIIGLMVGVSLSDDADNIETYNKTETTTHIKDCEIWNVCEYRLDFFDRSMNPKQIYSCQEERRNCEIINLMI